MTPRCAFVTSTILSFGYLYTHFFVSLVSSTYWQLCNIFLSQVFSFSFPFSSFLDNLRRRPTASNRFTCNSISFIRESSLSPIYSCYCNIVPLDSAHTPTHPQIRAEIPLPSTSPSVAPPNRERPSIWWSNRWLGWITDIHRSSLGPAMFDRYTAASPYRHRYISLLYLIYTAAFTVARVSRVQFSNHSCITSSFCPIVRRIYIRNRLYLGMFMMFSISLG